VIAAQGLGWPVPVVYADAGPAGQPGTQLAALAEAITAGRHDAVIITHPAVIGDDLAQIEAFTGTAASRPSACACHTARS